jgi:hypothetical protein
VNNTTEAHDWCLNAGRERIEAHWAHSNLQATLRQLSH